MLRIQEPMNSTLKNDNQRYFGYKNISFKKI